jgi:hypothetical protein
MTGAHVILVLTILAVLRHPCIPSKRVALIFIPRANIPEFSEFREKSTRTFITIVCLGSKVKIKLFVKDVISKESMPYRFDLQPHGTFKIPSGSIR